VELGSSLRNRFSNSFEKRVGEKGAGGFVTS